MNGRAKKFRRAFVASFFQIPVFVLTIMLSIGAVTAYAGVTATISGVVRDPSGAVIPGAQVIARNHETGTAVTVLTDAQGFYSLQLLSHDICPEFHFHCYQHCRCITGSLRLKLQTHFPSQATLEIWTVLTSCFSSLDEWYDCLACAYQTEGGDSVLWLRYLHNHGRRWSRSKNRLTGSWTIC